MWICALGAPTFSKSGKGVVQKTGSTSTRSAGKYEVKTSDLAFLVIPVLLAALATGKLKGFDLFGVKADLSALWSEAAQDEIKPQIARGAPVSIQDVMQAAEMAMKGGASELRFLERRHLPPHHHRLWSGDQRVLLSPSAPRWAALRLLGSRASTAGQPPLIVPPLDEARMDVLASHTQGR